MFIVHLCNIYILRRPLCGLLGCVFEIAIISTMSSFQKAKGLLLKNAIQHLDDYSVIKEIQD